MPSDPAAPAAPAPPTAPARHPWRVPLLLWLALVALVSLALWHLRREAVASQTRELGLLSLAVTDEIDRGLRGVEEGLQALRAEVREGRLRLDRPSAARELRTRAELMPLVETLWLVDADGSVVAASEPGRAPSLSSFAPALSTLAPAGTAISRPFAGSDGRGPFVALAMRFDAGPGGARGWILAAMPARALLGAFSAAMPAVDARMAVLRADGVRLAGVNVAVPTGDEAGVARRLEQRPSMELRRFHDGSENLVSLHSVPRYDIKVAVSRGLAAVLRGWRQAAEGATLALLLLGLVMAAALHFVLRADRRRAQAQQALQAQLTRASRLESLGTLAGGVAHDFNNVLAGIVGYGEMAADAAPPGSAQARHLDKVLKAAARGKALVERILAFSRGGARASTVFEFEPVVEEVLTLLSGSLRPGVVLERVLEAPKGRLRGDATQAFEAVMNLCTNALQAMPEGGMLSVRLRREGVTQPQVLSHSALPPGEYLALTVADQGSGITPAVMEHLFEPFFTTRGGRSGTGLGLAVVHGVVAEFGGAIDVASDPGQGARFTLYLPESRAALPLPEGGAGNVRPGQGQPLLVLDDEPELVAMAVEMLQGLGYAPEGFVDAEAALRALREQPGHYAAVITDEVMPVLAGTQLTERLRAFEPRLPVLLVSGYGGSLLARRAAEAGVTRVLAKPLQRADLARALMHTLHGG